MKKLNDIFLMIRSVLFLAVLYIGTLIMLFLFIPTLFLSCKQAGCFPRIWSRIMPFFLRVICGVQVRIEGLENLPKENGYIVASKHQSALETMIFHSVIPNAFYVLKRELMLLPFAGIYFLKTGCIPIDRKGGAKTMRQMLKRVQKRLSEEMNLIIFPEGTRTAPGTKKPYTPGVAFLYEQCQVPVVPVALNTGYCWPKNKTKKIPGKVTVRILPPIAPGMERRAFLNELYKRIETAQDELLNPFTALK